MNFFIVLYTNTDQRCLATIFCEAKWQLLLHRLWLEQTTPIDLVWSDRCQLTSDNDRCVSRRVPRMQVRRCAELCFVVDHTTFFLYSFKYQKWWQCVHSRRCCDTVEADRRFGRTSAGVVQRQSLSHSHKYNTASDKRLRMLFCSHCLLITRTQWAMHRTPKRNSSSRSSQTACLSVPTCAKPSTTVVQVRFEYSLERVVWTS